VAREKLLIFHPHRVVAPDRGHPSEAADGNVIILCHKTIEAVVYGRQFPVE